MMVREKKRPPAHKAPGGQPTQKQQSVPFQFPAPIRGWVLNENRTIAQPGGARILDNWIPTTTGISARGGCRLYATVHASDAVSSMWTYKVGDVEKFFAASATTISEITTVADANVPPTPDVTGQSVGYYSTEQFGTAGGDFLYAVNGGDDPQLYDGSTWTAINGASTPAITGVTTSSLSHVWSFANRLFFVEKNSLIAWYLPVDSIGGAANSFSLAGIFKKGGALLFGGKWSTDAGDGLDDMCVFVSTEGEVAVYSGTNPGSASDWSKQGVYQITKPLGQNATTSAGGDLLIATEAGVVPLSEAVRRDIASLEVGAISRNITPYWRQQALAISSLPWEIIKVPSLNLMVVSQPDSIDAYGSCLVANLQTGAWARFLGWRTRCLGVFGNRGYFGSDDGKVYLMNAGGSDNGAIYTCTYLGAHESLGAALVQKTVVQMRPVFQAAHPILPQLTARADFNETLPAPPSSVPNFSLGVWDEGLWDEALWDSASVTIASAQWVAVGVTGYSIAPLLQMTFGVTPTPKVELVSIDATYHAGALVA